MVLAPRSLAVGLRVPAPFCSRVRRPVQPFQVLVSHSSADGHLRFHFLAVANSAINVLG